jgi:glutamate racemase
MNILDSSEIVAHALKDYLEKEALMNTQSLASHQFLVSDYTESFEAAARMFFHQSVHLEKYPLWNG